MPFWPVVTGMSRWLNWFRELIVSRYVIWHQEYSSPVIDEWSMSTEHWWIFVFVARQPRAEQGTSHSLGLHWTSDQPDAETSTWQHKTLTRHRHPCPCGTRNHNPNKRPQTHVLDSAATGIGLAEWYWEKTEVSEKNLIQCYFVHYKTNLEWSRTESNTPPAVRSLWQYVTAMSRLNE